MEFTHDNETSANKVILKQIKSTSYMQSTEDTPIKNNQTNQPQDDYTHLQIPEWKENHTQHIQNHDSSWKVHDTLEKWEPCRSNDNFEYIHSITYETIEDWTRENDAKHHPFYPEWQKAKYKGVHAIQSWDHIRTILQLHSYDDYIKFINQCPKIPITYKYHWDITNNILRFCWNHNAKKEDIYYEQTHLQGIYSKLKQMSYDFEQQRQHLMKRIQQIDLNMSYYHDTITQQRNKSNQHITMHTHKQVKEFIDKTTENVAQITNQIKMTAEHHITQAQETISSLTQTAQQTIELQMAETLAKAEENIQTRIQHYTTQALQDLTEYMAGFKNNNTEQPAEQHIPKSKRFPNVNTDTFTSPHIRTNPYQNPQNDTENHNTVHQQCKQSAEMTSDEEWGRFGPTDDITETIDYRPLPPLFSHKMINRIKIPYKGKESSYTWYRSLRSAIQEYGILLINIEQFKPDKSLCPKRFYGTKVDSVRYRDMANSLYQLLALPETVSSDHTEVRNIIHRHSGNTDGYSTLYGIMERIHPLLNPDAKLETPDTTNCSDIHDYANQMDSYFLHAKMKDGRQFTPRMQVNMFIDGMDPTYAPAIRQIRQQMRSWKKGDLVPPDDLVITELPRTVERIMNEEEELDKPIIRATMAGILQRPIPQRKIKGHPPRSYGRQQPDVQCSFCKLFGHKRSQCAKMATHLLLQDATSTIDEKFKTKIIDNYMKQLQEKKQRRILNMKGTVRQLYTEGNFEEAEALWDTYMDQMANISSDDDKSTSSDE